MLKKVLLLVLILLLLLPAALAQDDDNPTIAILSLGPFRGYVAAEGAILDMLESYGYISTEENRMLEEHQDLAGENLNVIWGDAAWDLATANLLVENALDQDIDVLIVTGTAMTQTAVKATLDMEDPPIVLFTGVYSPYEAGIAQAACIKPAHVTGSEALTDYNYVFSALSLQDPDMESIGIIHSASEASGVIGAEIIKALAEEIGWTVEVAAVTGLADLRPAAEGLLSKGVQAFVLPTDELSSSGLPIVVTVANENGVPVFHSTMMGASLGATVGSGFFRYYQQGTNVGIVLTGYLNGDVDIASTAINVSSTQGTAVNLSTAEEQGVELSEALLDQAIMTIRDGEIASVSPDIQAIITTSGGERDGEVASESPDMMKRVAATLRGTVIPAEVRGEADKAFLAAIQCTDEMIAEQQAELDASE